jgi:hypothetical protein
MIKYYNEHNQHIAVGTGKKLNSKVIPKIRRTSAGRGISRVQPITLTPIFLLPFPQQFSSSTANAQHPDDSLLPHARI